MISAESFKAIADLDLEPIKVKLMHDESGEGWSLEKVNAVEFEYRRFLYLMKTFPNEQTAPLMDVDIFWHYHILDTMKYFIDCENVFGYYLHHFPYIGLRGEDDEAAHERVGNRMKELYEETFGEAYLRGAQPADAAYSGRVAADAQTAYSGRVASEAKTAYSGRVASEAKTAYSGRVASDAKTAYSGRVADDAKIAYSGRVAGDAKTAYSGRVAADAKTAYSGRVASEAQTAYSGRVAANTQTAYSGRVAGEAQTAYSGRVAVSAQTAYSGRVGSSETQAAEVSKFYGDRPRLANA
ncbi:glycine-rich domain-containing protein-like [Massilia sp. SR12]